MIIKKYLLVALLIVLAGCVSLQPVASPASCKHQPFMTAVDQVVANGGPNTKQIAVLDDQEAINRLREEYNRTPPITAQAEHADQLIALVAPSFPGMVYVLGYKGCLAGMAIIDPRVFQRILSGQGESI
jgi:hypothetical protein